MALPTVAAREQYCRDFQRDGYCVVRGLFSPEDMARITEAFERIRGPKFVAVVASRRDEISVQLRRNWTPGSRGGANVLSDAMANFRVRPHPEINPELVIAHPKPEQLAVGLISQCGKEEPALAELGRDPRLLTLAAGVLGRHALGRAGHDSLHQIINQAHFKAPGDGVSFAWHQDSTNRGVPSGRYRDVAGNATYVNITVAVDPETEENGPLGVFPLREAARHLEVTHFSDDVFKAAGYASADRAVYPLLQPGDALCLGMYVIHGSEANTSADGRWRRSFINGMPKRLPPPAFVYTWSDATVAG